MYGAVSWILHGAHPSCRKVEWLLRCWEAKKLTRLVKEAAIVWRRTSLNWMNASFCKQRLLFANYIKLTQIQLNSSGSEIKKNFLRQKTSMAGTRYLGIKCLNSGLCVSSTTSASKNWFYVDWMIKWLVNTCKKTFSHHSAAAVCCETADFLFAPRKVNLGWVLAQNILNASLWTRTKSE